jgi:hypothetical protein
MSSQPVVKRYENRQPGYRHPYVIEYRLESEGYYTIWCTEHPENPFDTSVVKCHLYSNGKVCVAAGKEPRTIEVAEAIAHYWMARYSEYVRRGVFVDDGGRVGV